MLAGINTALVTPFDADLEFDRDAMLRSVRHQLACGTTGLCALGGTGEPLSLSLEEHRRVIDTVVEETAGRVPVTVGCLLGGAADVLAAARHAEAAGADAIMLVPPYFYSARPFDIERHLQAVAEACSLPVILFHTPGAQWRAARRGRDRLHDSCQSRRSAASRTRRATWFWPLR